MCRPQVTRPMIFQLCPCHFALTACLVFSHGLEIIEKVNLSVLSYVICLSLDYNSG